MSSANGPHRLRPAESAEDWIAYHAIRRESIFARYFTEEAYDEKHPDESRPENLPHVLVFGDAVVGTVRIDLIDQVRAGFRLIGIRAGLQRQGHGTILLHLAERRVLHRGRREITINATARSLPFYLKHGYAEGQWKDAGPVPDQLIGVGKRLA